MRTYLLDSDILMDFFKKKTYALNLLDKFKKKGILAVSIVSITELRSGWNKEEAQFFLPRLYQFVTVKKLEKEIAERAGEFRWEYKRKGISLPTIDSIIAATAVVKKCVLVTNNRKDYPMPEVKLYDEEKETK